MDENDVYELFYTSQHPFRRTGEFRLAVPGLPNSLNAGKRFRRSKVGNPVSTDPKGKRPYEAQSLPAPLR
jgi:hypothetical protein